MPKSTLSPFAALLLLSTIFYCNFFSRIFFAPLLPVIEENLSLTHGEAGLFFLVLSTGYFISLVGSGFISARMNHRNTVVLSMVSMSAALFLIGSLSQFKTLLLSFLLLGLSAGVYLPSAISIISSLFKSHHWGRAFAVHELAPNLAFLTAPLFATFFLDAGRWQLAVFLLAAVTLSFGIMYFWLGKGQNLYGEPPNFALCTSIVFQKDFLILVLLFSAGISGTIGVFNVLPLFLVDNHAMTPQHANILVGLSRVASLGTALLGGWLADRFGNRKTITAVLLLTGCTTLLLGITDDAILTFVLFTQPVLAVCFFPAGFALLSKRSTVETRNVVISLAVPMAFVLGGGLLPSLITRMADFGLFNIGLILTGALISGAALLVAKL